MEQLKNFRSAKGLTQEALARKLGITLTCLGQVERGTRPAGRKFISAFKRAFPEVSVDEMFFSEEGR